MTQILEFKCYILRDEETLGHPFKMICQHYNERQFETERTDKVNGYGNGQFRIRYQENWSKD